ncbi:MAG: pseudouridylate synthase [Puniceicoccaceae bacterium]|nr:MAG: pseudouridylate synthase [Puniceicoccaceae bacterium]
MNPCPAPSPPLPILYQSEDYAAVDKPPGLLVHRTALDAGENRFCLQLLRDQLGRVVFPCHRLDKPTSGVLLFALHPEALRRARAAFQAGRIEKNYLAVVRGHLTGHGEVDHPLVPETSRCGRRSHPEPQPAVTCWQALSRTELPHPVGPYPTARYTLLRLTPQTGRRHQLRRHLAHLRHPIIGDTRHGDGAHNRFFRAHFNCHRLLLHAESLILPHDLVPGGLRIHAPLDSDFTVIWQALRRPTPMPGVPLAPGRPQAAP